MYIPSAFNERREALILSLIDKNPFGMVVTAEGSQPSINHIPMLHDPARREIHFHLAAQNPQVAQLRRGEPATLVFQGANAYVSPRWYEQAGVPTWNFMAMHLTAARGVGA